MNIALHVALENDTLVYIATTFLQDAFHSMKFLTVLSTDLRANKVAMLPISNCVENTARSIPTSLDIRDQNQEAKRTGSVCTAYTRSLQKPKTSPVLIKGPVGSQRILRDHQNFTFDA